MGMFDRMYDADGNEWQTKAFGRTLNAWRVGDHFPSEVPNFQCKVIGDTHTDYSWGFATIRDCTLTEVTATRDPSVLLIDYGGGVLELPAT